MSQEYAPPTGLRTWVFRTLAGVIAVGIPFAIYFTNDWGSYWYWYSLLSGPCIAVVFGDFAIFGYKDSFSERMQALWKRVQT